MRNDFIPKRIVESWNRVPRAVVESSFLQRLKSCVDMVLRDML